QPVGGFVSNPGQLLNVQLALVGLVRVPHAVLQQLQVGGAVQPTIANVMAILQGWRFRPAPVKLHEVDTEDGLPHGGLYDTVVELQLDLPVGQIPEVVKRKLE